MYYSYLRGKQYELLAIRNSIDKISSSNSTPIIEPVKNSTRDLLKCIETIKDKDSNCILIGNPQHGELTNNQNKLDELLTASIDLHPQLQLGFIVDDGTTIGQVDHFLSSYPDQSICLIHNGMPTNPVLFSEFAKNTPLIRKNIFLEENCSNSYRELFSHSERVILRDGFKKKPRNEDYRSTLDEFFTDLNTNYIDAGYQGFGDFSIVGNHYSEGGGQAIVAAIHLTYASTSGDIFIRHFLSEQRSTPEEVPILLEEAILNVETFIEDHDEILTWSDSCRELLNLRSTSYKTNLANIKKLTISHHFELMHRLLANIE